jgi:hypothetical protein
VVNFHKHQFWNRRIAFMSFYSMLDSICRHLHSTR